MAWLVGVGAVAVLILFLGRDGDGSARSVRAAGRSGDGTAPTVRTASEPTAGDTLAVPADPAAPGSILLDVLDGENKPLDAVDLVLRRDEGIRDGISVTTFLDVPFERERDAWVATGLAPGSYVVSIGAPEREPVNVAVDVPAGERVCGRINLLRNPAVHGFITDESGMPLAGLLVLFSWNGGSGIGAAYTSGNGAFHVVPAGLSGADGTGYLEISDPRGVYAETRCKALDPLHEVHRIKVARATRIFGRLVPRSGDRLHIYWECKRWGTEANVPVGPDGSFALTDLPHDNDIYLTIVPPGSAPIVRGPLKLEKSGQHDLGDLELGHGLSLWFLVRSTNSEPLEDLRAIVLCPGMSLGDARVVECPADVVRMDLLPDGPILVHVEARGMEGEWIRIDNVATFRTDGIRLRPAGVLDATVLDTDGNPVEGAVIFRYDARPTFEENGLQRYEVPLPPTDAQGHARVCLAEGLNILRLTGANSTRVEIRSGETTSIEIRRSPDRK